MGAGSCQPHNTANRGTTSRVAADARRHHGVRCAPWPSALLHAVGQPSASLITAPLALPALLERHPQPSAEDSEQQRLSDSMNASPSAASPASLQAAASNVLDRGLRLLQEQCALGEARLL